MTFYRVVRFFVSGIPRLVWRLRMRGTERIPATGACVLAPSHRSTWDIPFLAATTRRRVRFMGKREAFEWPVIGRLFPALGGFPVERDGDDRAALRKALAILTRDGEPLVVYPEGTRQRGTSIHALQPGAAYLALRAGVPIVPVGIAGTEEINHDPTSGRTHRLPRLGRVAIVVGEPLHPAPRNGGPVRRAEVDALTEELHAALQKALDEAYALRA
jgi:1-acyl-sn-glycerol-3-phosphate acyltransferase